VAGVSNPEISDLTRKQPQPRRHDLEDFVPGGDFLSLWSANLFAIMKAASLDTPAGINTMLPALRTPGIRTEHLGHST
jgi:hypothetical protein